VIHNMNSPVDYRRLAHHTRGIYFLTPDRTALLHAAFLEAGQDSMNAGRTGPAAAASDAAGGVGLGNPGPRSVQVAMGRQLTVPQALGKTLRGEGVGGAYDWVGGWGGVRGPKDACSVRVA